MLTEDACVRACTLQRPVLGRELLRFLRRCRGLLCQSLRLGFHGFGRFRLFENLLVDLLPKLLGPSKSQALGGASGLRETSVSSPSDTGQAQEQSCQ